MQAGMGSKLLISVGFSVNVENHLHAVLRKVAQGPALWYDLFMPIETKTKTKYEKADHFSVSDLRFRNRTNG
jgi:hypothetical protein